LKNKLFSLFNEQIFGVVGEFIDRGQKASFSVEWVVGVLGIFSCVLHNLSGLKKFFHTDTFGV